jgi:beta-barrel assembly-enhancing protease
MTASLAALALLSGLSLGGLFGGGDHQTDCRESAEGGARVMQVIVDTWPLRLSADPVRQYIQGLGERLAQHSGSATPGEEWRFFVVRNLEPTAFAVGGRRFLVSDGLIAFVRNESDLAAVLAHEIAHQKLDHFCLEPRRDAERIWHGSIVQHFDLDVEKAADAEALRILAQAGLDQGSMYEVLRCLSERPGAPVQQLSMRMSVLQTARGLMSVMPRDDGVNRNFEQARASVLSDLGEHVPRCR